MSSVLPLAKLLSKRDLISILDVIDASLAVGNESQFQDLMQRAAQVIPIETAHVSVADLDAHSAITNSSRHISIGFPAEWMKTYRSESFYKIDPIAGNLFSANEPLIWARVRERSKTKTAKAFYKQAADFGLLEGFSFGTRFTRSASASFFTCTGKELTHKERHIQITRYLLPHLHAALGKVHFNVLKDIPPLTPRELEALNWAKYGKSNWEISLQLNCSQRTVKFHIENAIKKLGAANRSQAIALALSQQLIAWD